MRWLKVAGVITMVSAGSAWAQMEDQEEVDLFEPQEEPIGQPEEPVIDPFAPSEEMTIAEEEPVLMSQPQSDMKGLTVMGGGGVEGYTGDFASQIDPGVGWGVTANIKPWSALGLELGYSGAANEVDTGVAGTDQGLASGTDIVRNGGHAAVIVGTPTPVQGYALGGVGVDRYTFRGDDGTLGFQDDTSASVPLGLGLRTHAGDFVADLRLGYDLLLNDEFSPVDDAQVTNGRYTGKLQVGGTF